METRTYNVTVREINSNSVSHTAWIDDGWMAMKCIRFNKKNKQGLNWNFNNSQNDNGTWYKRTSMASHLEKGLNYAMEKLVELKDGLKFEVTIANDEYERPVVSNVTVEARNTDKPVDNTTAKETAATLLN